jgi:hypothetical protein
LSLLDVSCPGWTLRHSITSPTRAGSLSLALFSRRLRRTLTLTCYTDCPRHTPRSQSGVPFVSDVVIIHIHRRACQWLESSNTKTPLFLVTAAVSCAAWNPSILFASLAECLGSFATALPSDFDKDPPVQLAAL